MEKLEGKIKKIFVGPNQTVGMAVFCDGPDRESQGGKKKSRREGYRGTANQSE